MRTNGDVFMTVISEILGRPRSFAEDHMSKFREAFPDSMGKFDEEITEQEYNDLLAKLEPTKPAILNWLIEGWRRAKRKESQ